MIIPTIDYTDDGYSPRFSFADSTGSFPTPEFYAPYPVFTSEDSTKLEERCSIYKLIPMDHPEEATSIEVQLFDGDIGLKSDVVSIDAYIAWSNREQADELASVPGRSPNLVNTLEESEFEFDSATGTLTVPLNAKLARVLNALYGEIQRVESEPDSSGCSYYVIFRVNIEKYRSIEDLRDLTSEQVNKIATAQAIEASILEYNYQFNLAVQTQTSYHELFYTAIVTAVSTAITMGASLGVGKIVEQFGSLANTAAKELSQSASKILSSLLEPTAGFTVKFVAKSVIKEIGQEILIDPWIESAVSGMVRRAGGDAMLQMVLSSVAESLRETLTGPFTSLLSSQQSEGASLYERFDAKYFSKGLNPTVQDLLDSFSEYKAEIKAQIELRKDQTTNLGRGFKVLTFVVGAAGFGVAQFIGPPASLFYATLTTFCFTEEISLKNIFSKKFNPVMITAGKISESKVGDVIRNTKEFIINNLGIGIWASVFGPMTSFLTLYYGTVGFLGGIGLAVASLFGMVKIKEGMKIKVGEIENFILLKENRVKKAKERVAILKKTLAKLYYEVGREVEKYSYLAGIATNPTGVTAALLRGIHSKAGLRSLEGILKLHGNPEKIFNQIQIKLKEKIEFSHWAIIQDKFEKAISLKRHVADLNRLIGAANLKKDNFDIRVSKYPSKRTNLIVDLFDFALKYLFTSRQDGRDRYAQVFSDIVFGNSWYLTHGFLYDKGVIQSKVHPTSLFMMLFNIFQLDTLKIQRRVGNIRKFTKSNLNDFKLACYSRVKEFFFDDPSYVSDYSYSQDPQGFELEFDLLWSVWYAYVEWYANKHPSILDDMFDQDSPFRKKFSDSYFFKGFTGVKVGLFKFLQNGYFISKRHVFTMVKKLTQMRKNMGTSSFPNQHAIENAVSVAENYLQVRHPEKKGDKSFQHVFFVNKILVSSKGALLPRIYRLYLKVASNLDGLFPFSPTNYKKMHPNDYQRCSDFKIQVGTITKDYSEFIKNRLVSKFSDLRSDKILVVDSVKGKNSPKPILDLLKLVKSFSGFDPKNFLNPSHQAIIGMAKAKLSDYVLATELSIWRKVGAKLVTGHIDLVLLIGDTLFVCDYKPGYKPDPSTNIMSKSFLMSLPQIAAYSKLHRSQYSIKKIYCVTFNEKGQAWIYQDKVLDSLESLLIAKGYSNWLIWKNYIV